jgi:hypothetical protein
MKQVDLKKHFDKVIIDNTTNYIYKPSASNKLIKLVLNNIQLEFLFITSDNIQKSLIEKNQNEYILFLTNDCTFGLVTNNLLYINIKIYEICLETLDNIILEYDISTYDYTYSNIINNYLPEKYKGYLLFDDARLSDKLYNSLIETNIINMLNNNIECGNIECGNIYIKKLYEVLEFTNEEYNRIKILNDNEYINKLSLSLLNNITKINNIISFIKKKYL